MTSIKVFLREVWRFPDPGDQEGYLCKERGWFLSLDQPMLEKKGSIYQIFAGGI